MNTNTTTTTGTWTVRVPLRVLSYLQGTDDYYHPQRRADDAVEYYRCVATARRCGSRGISAQLTIPAIQYLYKYADYMYCSSEDDASWQPDARADRRSSKALMDALRDLVGNQVYRQRVIR